MVPTAYLPHGSIRINVKSLMDSSAPVNLKYSVWSIITAAIILKIQETIFIWNEFSFKVII
jgi:hypothetical protein